MLSFKEKVMQEKEFMEKAIKLAEKGRGKVHPNPLVGCVIVKNAQIVGQGFYEGFGGKHAEISALKQAGKQAKDAEMFVSLEPCNFFGKTPACTDAIVKAGIKKVNVAMLDPNKKVNSKGVKELRGKGVKVKVGLCREEAEELNKAYIKWVVSKRPFVLLKVALTSKGFISWGDGRNKRISGKKALERVHELRNVFDAVLVGINTVLLDDSRLTCRGKGGRNPIRVLLDPKLECPFNANFLNGNARIVFCGKKASKGKKGKLQDVGVEVVRVKGKDGLLDLNEVLKELGKRNIVNVMVEGGQAINSSFLMEGLVDRVMFFISEKKVKEGLFFVNENVKQIRLKDCKAEKVGEDLVIEGYLK